MKLKQIPKEELELMGYDDIALLILQESGKKMKLRDIFAKVINVLGLPEETIDEELMEFFELMSTNKKFVMLDKGYWDLQSRHKLDLVFDMEEDDEELENEEEDNIFLLLSNSRPNFARVYHYTISFRSTRLFNSGNIIRYTETFM